MSESNSFSGENERLVGRVLETAQFLQSIVEPDPQSGIVPLSMPIDASNPQYNYFFIEGSASDEQSPLTITHRTLGKMSSTFDSTPDVTVTYEFRRADGRLSLWATEDMTGWNLGNEDQPTLHEHRTEPYEVNPDDLVRLDESLNQALGYALVTMRQREALEQVREDIRRAHAFRWDLQARTENLNRSWWSRLLGRTATAESVMLKEALAMNKEFNKKSSTTN